LEEVDEEGFGSLAARGGEVPLLPQLNMEVLFLLPPAPPLMPPWLPPSSSKDKTDVEDAEATEAVSSSESSSEYGVVWAEAGLVLVGWNGCLRRQGLAF